MITEPKVDGSIEGEQAREKLQTAIGMLTSLANEIGSFTLIELDRNPLVKRLWALIPDIEQKLKNLATDDIPF